MPSDLSELTPGILAAKLKLTEEAFFLLCQDAPRLYRESRRVKKDGGIRLIEAPFPVLKEAQRRLLDTILHRLPVHPRLFGMPGSNIKSAVSDHVRKPMVITLDIRDFFPSVSAVRIASMFRRKGASPEMAKILTRLVSRKKHLPQGAPTSPCIGRLVLYKLSCELEKLLRGVDSRCEFSIYVDDITISGPAGIRRMVDSICGLVRGHGFEIKEAKIHTMSSSVEQHSLNVRLNRRMEATTEFLREIEELAAKLAPNDPTLIGKRAYAKFLKS